jgi:uncharacterized protein (TIGR02300 family)
MVFDNLSKRVKALVTARCTKKDFLVLTDRSLHGKQTGIKDSCLLIGCIMVDPKLGTKRTCEACEAKFYDLNKVPAICPKCNHSFDPNAAAVAATPRKIEPEAAPEVEEDEDELEEDEDAISLETLGSDDDGDDDEASLPDFEEGADDKTLLDDEDEDDEDSYLEDDDED